MCVCVCACVCVCVCVNVYIICIVYQTGSSSLACSYFHDIPCLVKTYYIHDGK